MSQATPGDTVKVHYTGTLDDGTRFDSSEGREPLELKLGAGQVIPGFDAAIRGMSVGDARTVTIPAAEAYGPHDPERVQEVPRAAVPPEIELQPGMMLSASGPGGQTLNFQVVGFDDESVKIDGNHPLAGQDLTFALELVEIA
jgi:FKBP-type peptidyl-prolyl cis-trans isomerase 2